MTGRDTTNVVPSILVAATIFATAAVAILWSWNTIATDMFGLARMEFRHAIATEILLLAIGALVGLRPRIAPLLKG